MYHIQHNASTCVAGSTPQTQMGNCLALRGLQCIHLGGRYYVPGLFEAPFSSKVRYLPSWRAIENKEGINQVRADSCAYGSPHLKPFRFLGSHVKFQATGCRCKCKQLGKKHIQVQGQYTKKSATYTPALAGALADDLTDVILARRRANLEDGPRSDGLEDQLMNEVISLATGSWLAHGQ